MRAVWVGAAVALAVAGAARADPRLDEKVYAPYVQNGLGEFEARTAGLIDPVGGAEQTTVFELEYGVSDHLSLALVGALHDDRLGGSRWTDVGVEGVWRLGTIPKVGVDAGLYLEYGHGLNGEADFVEGKLLLAKRAGRFEGLFNLILERPLNAPAGGNAAGYGCAASATWRTVGSLRLGVEALGDLGDDHSFGGRQGAFIGPQLKWELHPFGKGPDLDGDDDGDEPAATGRHPPIEIDIDAGWLAAVGPDRAEAPSQARIGIEVERKF